MPNGTPSMTRKHFQAIAEVLRDTPVHPTREQLAKALADVLPSGLKTRYVTNIVDGLATDDEGKIIARGDSLAHGFARYLNATNDYFDSGRFIAVATGERER